MDFSAMLNELMSGVVPEIKGLADVVLILLTWAASVMTRGILRGALRDPPWLATEGNRDLIVPTLVVIATGVASEWSTPEFNILIAVKRMLILGGGVFFIYRPSLFLQALPDWMLNLWPNTLGGQQVRAAVAEQSSTSVKRDLV